ncbi:hypothetical protein FOA52_002094 [Chlamydomonas sp. UWO 241]|nr:hypothetical protein FOA52_002094 [Chlamydomonas sp. UWO 241]
MRRMYASLPLLLALLISAAPQAQARVLQQEDNGTATGGDDAPMGYAPLGAVDIRGNDLAQRYCRVSLSACATRCDGDAECGGFTYVGEGNKTGDQCCYVKSWEPAGITEFRDGDSGSSYLKDAVYDTQTVEIPFAANETTSEDVLNPAVPVIFSIMLTNAPKVVRQPAGVHTMFMATDAGALSTFRELRCTPSNALDTNNRVWQGSVTKQHLLPGVALDLASMAPGTSVVEDSALIYRSTNKGVLTATLQVAKDASGTVTVNGARVVSWSKSGDGMVVMIDRLLLPPLNDPKRLPQQISASLKPGFPLSNIECYDFDKGLACCLPGSAGAGILTVGEGIEPCVPCSEITEARYPALRRCFDCKAGTSSAASRGMICE